MATNIIQKMLTRGDHKSSWHRNNFGQSAMEYILLAVIAIIGILAVGHIGKIRDGGLSRHFDKAASYIGNGSSF